MFAGKGSYKSLGGGASTTPAQKSPAALLAQQLLGGGATGGGSYNASQVGPGIQPNSGGMAATVTAKSGGTAASSANGMPMLSQAQKDPRVEAWQNNLSSRYNSIKGKENTQDPFLMESVNNLRNRQSTDTTRRAMDQANAGAADQTAGLMSQMQSQAARTGRGSGWGGAEAQGAGQRLAAKQNAQIQMNELGRQDNLALQGANILNQPSALQTAQSGQANSFALGAAGLADQGAKLGLAQQGLGLEQWKAGSDANYKQALLNQQGQQGMFDNYLKLLGTVGY